MNTIDNTTDDLSRDMGKLLMSWVYRAERSRSFIAYLVGLVGAAAIFIIFYARHFVPWLNKVPDMLLYLFVFTIGPLLNVIKMIGRDRRYELYENGFIAVPVAKEKPVGEAKVGYWHDYASCSYTAKSVVLSPDSPWKGKAVLRLNANAAAVYAVCREQINLAQTKRLTSMSRKIEAPDTYEQRKLKSYEKRSQWNSPEGRRRGFR